MLQAIFNFYWLCGPAGHVPQNHTIKPLREYQLKVWPAATTVRGFNPHIIINKG
jgi:hypothetical protein